MPIYLKYSRSSIRDYHKMVILFLQLLLNGVSLVAAGVHDVWWNITYVQDINPDGLFIRRAIGVNGKWPPPPISVNVSDTLIVHATNSLDHPSSLHHHGLFINSSSWYDGGVGISQCGIPPGATFSYIIPLNSSGQWGTFWVHSHFPGQYGDGLRAPLILRPREELYSGKYDDEFIVVLNDWYHAEHETLLEQYINVDNPAGVEPVPDSALIYFAKGVSYLPPIPSSLSDVYPTTSDIGFNINATLPFEAGKTYRLRIINMSVFAGFYFWIDGHNMSIIEVDSTDIQESSIDVINIDVGQRYSILVKARNDTQSNWAIHANMDTDMFDTVPSTLNPNITASITYSPSANLIDLSPVPEDFYKATDDTSLIPMIPEAQLPPANRIIELEAAFYTMNDGTSRATFNNVTFHYPKVPTAFTQVQYADQHIPRAAYGHLTFILDHLDVVDLIIKNTDAGKHPFHLHGHMFQIVNRASNYSSTDPILSPPLVEGQANPIRRDSVSVFAHGSVTLRFVADNPGSWMFHCHIDWHMIAGLAVVFIEATPLLANASIPQPLKDQCVAQGLLAKGNAAGHMNPNNLRGLPSGPFLP